MQILPEKITQGSSAHVTLTFSVTPSSVVWSLLDLDEGVVNGRNQVVATPGTTVEIWLTGNDLQMYAAETERAYRYILVEAVHADGLIKDTGRFVIFKAAADSTTL